MLAPAACLVDLPPKRNNNLLGIPGEGKRNLHHRLGVQQASDATSLQTNRSTVAEGLVKPRHANVRVAAVVGDGDAEHVANNLIVNYAIDGSAIGPACPLAGEKAIAAGAT